jgi:hypothetical protein
MTRILPLLAVVALAWALVTHLRWMGGFRLDTGGEVTS